MHRVWLAVLSSLCLITMSGFEVSAAVRTPALMGDAQAYQRTPAEFAAAIVIDTATGKRLYQYQPDLAWTPASLTKLMNALVTVERKPNWNKVVALSSKDEVGGGRLRVATGAKMTMQDLFYSAIVASANNAAQALARVSGFSVNGFIKRMNQKAVALGMTHTTFYDPVGMDARNQTTAADLVKLATAAFKNVTIQRAASTPKYVFPIRNSRVVKTLTSTNKLLLADNGLFVTGGKTGYLAESKYNLIVRMKGDPADPARPELLVVVLGAPTSQGSFDSAESLAKWAWGAYRW